MPAVTADCIPRLPLNVAEHKSPIETQVEIQTRWTCETPTTVSAWRYAAIRRLFIAVRFLVETFLWAPSHRQHGWEEGTLAAAAWQGNMNNCAIPWPIKAITHIQTSAWQPSLMHSTVWLKMWEYILLLYESI